MTIEFGFVINSAHVRKLAQFRAGGNGTAGTAMAVPVFEGEKWRHLDSNLACVIECPLRALRRSLGQLRGLQAFKVATRELRLLNFGSSVRSLP